MANERNLNLTAGNPVGFLQLGQSQSENIAQATPSQTFNLALMRLLQQYQTLGTKPFAEQELGAREAQAKRLFETPSSLIGAAPGVQSGVRQAAVQALEPTVQGAATARKTFGEQITSFGNALEMAGRFGENIAKQETENQKTAQTIVDAAIKSGSAGLKELLRVSPDIFKKAGYGTKEFEAVAKGLEAMEIEDKRRFQIKEGSGISSGISPLGQYSFNTPQDIAELPISDLTKSVIAGYGDVKSLSPTDKALVQTELYRVGFNPYEQINRKLDALFETYKLVNTGATGLLGGFTPARFSATAKRFESEKQLLTREIARLRDVGVLSDQDVASYKQALPSRTDRNIEVAEAAIEGVKASLGSGLVGQKTGTIKIGGRDVQVGSIIVNSKGQKARVNSDGTLTPL